MIIAVTGWRDHTDGAFIRSYMNAYRSMSVRSNSLFHVRVGDAQGVDAIVVKWCQDNGISHKVFEALRYSSGALVSGEGPARNRRMLLGIGDHVSGATSLLVGFPRTDRGRITIPGSGTWGCMIKAAELGIKVEIPPYMHSGE
jgi:hypothetical protein